MADNEQIDTAPDVLETAAEWHARLNSGDTSDQDIERHMDWLLADPAHANAYEHVAATMQNADQFEQAARAAFAQDLSINRTAAPALKNKPELLSGWAWPQWSVAAAAVAVILFTVLVPGTGLFEVPSSTQSYIAAGDTVQSYTLADGSQVSLFAGSELTSTMQENERSVVLLRGRAFFDVTPDTLRPFRVTAGGRVVTVVGTRFEVLLGSGFERVAVNEGLVSVGATEEENGAFDPLLIKPGMVATYALDTAAPVITETAADSVGIWTEGVLPFTETSLPEVMAAIQALFPEKTLRLEGESLEDMKFSGTLVVSGAEKMMQQLGMFLELELTVYGDEIALMPK